MPAPPERGTLKLLHHRYVSCYEDLLTNHTAQAAKVTALQAAYRRREAETPRDQAPSAGQIRSLGLLNRKDEEVDIKHGVVLPTVESNVPK